MKACVGYICELPGLPPLAEQERAVRAWALALGLTLGELYRDEVLVAGLEERLTSLAFLLLDQADVRELTVIVPALEVLERADIPELAHLPAEVLVAGEDRPRPGAPRRAGGEARPWLKQGRYAAAAKGFFQSGPAPYGYRRETIARRRRIVPAPAEACVIDFMFRRYIELGSLKRLGAELARMGLRTRGGKAWVPANLSWILRNDVYIGRVRFGPVRAAGRHEPLVGRELYDRVQEQLVRNDRCRPGRSVVRAC